MEESLFRLLDYQGLGIAGGDSLQHLHLFLVDDLTCAAWGEEVMKRYLDVAADFCAWLGISVNLDKTEVCDYYNYGS